MTGDRSFRAGLLTTPVAVCALALAWALPAQASEVTFDADTGDTVFTAEPGETNRLNVTFETIDDDADNSTPEVDVIRYSEYQNGGMTWDTVWCIGNENNVYCPRDPALDSLSTVNLGDGNDELWQATPGRDAVNGGPGNDKLHGGGGNDAINGGDGNDTIRETIGSQIGPIGDGAGKDTVAGGAGYDRIEVGGYGSGVVVSVSLNGAADDGAPGEGDNIAGDIEEVSASGPSRFVGNDGPNVYKAGGDPSEADGGGGDDKLYGGVDNDKLNGGPGNDIVEGYGGADTIDGGSGNDDLSGEGGSTITDGTGGADTIFARDGSADTVSCGTRADRAVVDEFDIVAESGGSDTCEAVERETTVVVDDRQPPPPPPLTPIATLSLGTKAAKVKKNAFPLKLTCGREAACAGTISVKSGKTKIGSARLRIAAGKSKTVKVKLNAKGRKLIRKRKSLRTLVTLRLKGQAPRTARFTLRR